MQWIGLTGGIGSGKSTFAGILNSKRIPVINADELAHLALQPGRQTYDQVVELFGNKILDSSGQIDRKKLGAVVFGNTEELTRLENILHPAVREMAEIRKKELLENGQYKLAIYDVPLLYEKSMQKYFDAVVVVYCSEETQIQRVMERNGLSRKEVISRMSHQIPLTEKVKLADYVISNEGSLEDLEKESEKWIQSFN
tara:strand:- start:72821 stop:73414 length:594 start_codon:yes stop_codon:yes gene_type:complete